MATTQVTCYIAVCDGCALELEGDYIIHHGSPDDAFSDAIDSDWVWIEDKIYCEDCGVDRGFPCSDCDDLVEQEGARCSACGKGTA